MKIAVFGLGYVGAVSSACLAKAGHSVIGVDPNLTKVELINQGEAPIIEKDVRELIQQTVADGCLRATVDATSAIIESDLSLVCVGTPSASNGSLDLRYVEAVCKDIGSALAGKKNPYHTVVIRSTILPGTMRDVVVPTLEKASKMNAGKDFGLCNNPEFLREGTAVYDYHNPPKTVIGAIDERSAKPLKALI
jgi:GDP-mannose 6-dehydrogenase